MRYFGLIGIVTIYRHNNTSLLSPQRRCYSKSPRLICKDFVFKFDASNFFLSSFDFSAEEFERQQREQRERSTNRGRNHQGNSDRKNRRSKSSGFNGKRRDRRGY